MAEARRQAENYARALPVDHGYPPFLITVDVGQAIEIYADFSGLGKNYAHFPDRNSYRISLDDLRREEVRKRLKAVFTAPRKLDPTRHASRVTRVIAARPRPRRAPAGETSRSGRGGAIPDALPLHDVRRGFRPAPRARLS